MHSNNNQNPNITESVEALVSALSQNRDSNQRPAPSSVTSTRPLSINDQAPEFTAPAIVNGKPTSFESSTSTSEYTALVFYPGNFCSVTRSELKALSEKSQQLQQLNCKVVAVTPDSITSTMAFVESLVKEVPQPNAITIVSDSSLQISAKCGALNRNGQVNRMTLIVDGQRRVRSVTVTDPSVGRSAQEIVRHVSAIATQRANDVSIPAEFDGAQSTKTIPRTPAEIAHTQCCSRVV